MSTVKMKNILVALLFVCTFGVIIINKGYTEVVPESGLFVSFNLDHQELKWVLKLISRQTGYTVKVDREFISYKVTGNYSKVSVEKFFSRILKGHNVAVMVDEKDKIIIVKYFGKKKSSMYSVSYSTNGEVEPLTGISLSRIKSIQVAEEKYSQEYFNNPESVDPLTGMTLREIEEVRVREQNGAKDGVSIVEPLTGVSLGKIESIQTNEEEYSREYFENSDSVEPLTGMTLREIERVRVSEDRLARKLDHRRL